MWLHYLVGEREGVGVDDNKLAWNRRRWWIVEEIARPRLCDTDARGTQAERHDVRSGGSKNERIAGTFSNQRLGDEHPPAGITVNAVQLHAQGAGAVTVHHDGAGEATTVENVALHNGVRLLA